MPDRRDAPPQGLREDLEPLLRSAADPVQFPILSAALARPDGQELRHELARLLMPQLRLRAPRRYVRVLCRLEGPGYHEPVLLTDISATGVRFLVLADVPLDLSGFSRMLLHVKTNVGPRTMEVTLVRLCGGDRRHTDVACRFLSVASDHDQIVTEIRSRIFDTDPSPAEVAP